MQALRVAAIAIALLAASPAAAQASSQVWNDWVYRANSLLRAIAEGSPSTVNVMCRNIYREMAAKGLPKWARQLTGVCDALKEGTTRGRKGSFCRDARVAAAQLAAATPVAEERRAYPLAIQLSRAMEGLHQGLCS